ncbi:MAG: VTT domain-containing protein [Clostridia bacterium]
MDKKTLIKKSVLAGVSALLLLITVAFCCGVYSLNIKIALFSIVAFDILFFLIGLLRNNDRFYKLAILLVYFSIIALAITTAILKSGIFKSVDSAEELIKIIKSFGVAGKLVFVLVQFLQVTFIPIPSSIVTAAGAALFSPWECVLLSTIGLIIGSLFAFFLGRAFGVKLVKWVIGEEMLIKYNSFIKGRDKAMLIYMFLFPVFPDDMLCMLAGLTTMSYPGFIIVQLISRPLNVLSTVFLVDYLSLIPFSGLGLIVWALIALIFISVFIIMWKNSEKLEQFMIKGISKIFGRPLIKDIYTVYHIYNGAIPTKQTTDPTLNTDTETQLVIKRTLKSDDPNKENFEKAYTTINEIINKEDKTINF